MKEQLEQRLKELRAEYETGHARLRELETESAYVRETLLRITGAIQVLQEMLGEEKPQDKVAEPLQAEQAHS
jgi:predicted nuclease with TOPRIM domain